MHMIILLTHIIAASIMSVALIGVFISAYKLRETKIYQSMLASFGVTLGSGLVLIVMNPATLGHFCATMSVFTLSIIAIRSYYLKRISTISTL